MGIRNKEEENVVVNYFSELFTSTSPDEFVELLGEVPMVTTYQINDRFIVLASEEEIRKAIFMMHLEKAPGSYGMTALFYQRAWPLIKGKVLSFVNDFL